MLRFREPTPGGPGSRPQEFCTRVDGHTGRRPRTPEWDIHAVLSTLADHLTPTARTTLKAHLPHGLDGLLDPAPPG
ncbi:DUF2267 domain-containing protein [Streptomyces clavuligerus]|uniref:DUF2267 domain-containing protein n=1 Tax=Streptomyces clavuligerus TaxID=1901 RepID=UPI001E5BABD1|nr:DUF2267 domain-containing protein [Streptomyces clavuligerus]WDN57642.1 DUF2267 domain-containing protein [Streptomyces clavuligerus]